MEKTRAIMIGAFFLVVLAMLFFAYKPLVGQAGRTATQELEEGASGDIGGEPLFREMGGSGKEYYIYGAGLAASYTEEEGLKYHHQDHLGSTRLTTDASGGVVEENDFMPYGEPMDANEDRFTYTGKEQDLSGLKYFGARYYDPEIGRFISIDPIKDGMNFYAYANNNPMRFVDPKGMAVELDEPNLEDKDNIEQQQTSRDDTPDLFEEYRRLPPSDVPFQGYYSNTLYFGQEGNMEGEHQESVSPGEEVMTGFGKTEQTTIRSSVTSASKNEGFAGTCQLRFENSVVVGIQGEHSESTGRYESKGTETTIYRTGGEITSTETNPLNSVKLSSGREEISIVGGVYIPTDNVHFRLTAGYEKGTTTRNVPTQSSLIDNNYEGFKGSFAVIFPITVGR
jgi:RHS repeat-associated protein